MSKFRRGLVNHQSTGPQVVEQAQPVGRIFTSSAPLPVGRVPDSHRQVPQELVDSQGVSFETRRQGLVTPGGDPVEPRRGLVASSVEARQAQREAATEGEEQCTRCGLPRSRSGFRTLLKAEGSDQQIRVCEFCVEQAHKEGASTWKPQRQDVRFDRETGEAFDGIHMEPGELVNRDTYHTADLAAAVEPSLPHHTAPRIGKTHW